ncbi:MAG: hypothetical protein KKE96_08060 [Candidatus Altiarchaeota archaeon]|nr:hypothetical protein [Candidatus Altiarchaeota archaeon]MBU4341624.1 hypothetical protein [Candidatus Altiarchaeota archaeon]
MDSRPLLVLALLVFSVSGGCLSEGRARYFCPDGREVSDSGLCFATDGVCDSVSLILENRNRCNLKGVEVTGYVSEVDFRTSAAENNYTTFTLGDKGGELSVFAWGHLKIRDGDEVMVEGIFHKTKQVGRYSFENEIEADVVEVK